jgi:tetratricopeptide (TPR) repeat protein
VELHPAPKVKSEIIFARTLSRRAAELAPDSEAAQWARETVLRDQGKFEEAIAALERNPSLWVTNPWVWADKGTALERLGRLDEAHAAYSRAIELARNFEELRLPVLETRWRLLRRMNRFSEGQSDFLEAKRIPSRAVVAPGSRFHPVDLRPHLNQGLQDLALSRAMGATNSSAPVRMLAGVEFELCGYILMDDKNNDPAFPSRVLNIQIGKRASALHFLQSADPGANRSSGYLVASYVVHYAGAADESIPIMGARDVRWWFDPEKELGPWAAEAWNEKNDKGEMARLFKRSWNNPHPELEIQSIDLTSGGPGRLLLFAITVEE